MSKTIEKDGVVYFTMRKGDVVPDELLRFAHWGQKTHPTKIFKAEPGEMIIQPSGERHGIVAKGDEFVFDNGEIPVSFDEDGNVTETRHDIYVPTEDGRPTGDAIRQNSYHEIAQSSEAVTIETERGNYAVTRSFGMYLPLPNPQVSLELYTPVCLLNSFGEGDHQWTESAILRIKRNESSEWVISGAINGPEFKHTWTNLGSLHDLSPDQARENAILALNAKEESYRGSVSYPVGGFQDPKPSI